MEAMITYQNLDFPNICMRKKIKINSPSDLGKIIDGIKYELIQYESYLQGLRKNNTEIEENGRQQS